MASSTWDGCATPAEQAEPVEHSTPLASSSMSSASPSQPGKEKWALPGSRSPGSPLSTTSGTASRTRWMSSSRSADSRACRASCSRTAVLTAAARPAMAGASSVPERTSRSCPPPCCTDTGVSPLASSSAPAPMGPPTLWPVSVSASAPEPEKDTGNCPSACTASVWNGMPWSWAMAASTWIGWTVPTSLLAHMMLIMATSSGSRSMAARSVSGWTRPSSSTSSSSTSAPWLSASHWAGSSAAWCSTELISTRLRGLRAQ